MPESVCLQESPAAAGVRELDESVWQAWTTQHALRDRQGAAARPVTVQCASLGVLLFTTSLWGYVTSYEVAVGFVLSVGALVVAGLALRSRRYGFAAVFAAMTLIYNPVVATFPGTGGWPSPLVSLTVFAFAASLILTRDQPVGDPRRPSALTEGSAMKTDLSAWENEGGAPVPPELDRATEELKGARK